MERYLERQFPTANFKEAIEKDNTGNPFTILNNAFNSQWSYSIKTTLETGAGYLVTVTVYLPGTIRDGIGIAKVLDNAIAVAILNIIKTLDPNYKTPKEKGEAPKVETKVDTKVEDKPKTGLPPLKTDNTPPAPPVAEVSTATKQEQVLKQYMDKFKITLVQASSLLAVNAKFELRSTSKLLKYLQAWNPQITGVQDLNTNNIGLFIKWAEALEASFNPEEISK